MLTPTTVALIIIVFTFLLLTVVTWITVLTIDEPMMAEHQINLTASPFGYTVSLVLVIVPFLVLLYWYLKYPNRHKAHWRCLVRVCLLLTFAWLLLDILFAASIFYFPNCAATLGIRLPGYVPGSGFQPVIPIEEFLFYLFSALSLMMIYIWSSEVWFGKYALPDHIHRQRGRQVIPIVNFNPQILAIGVVLIILAIIIQRIFGHDPNVPPGAPQIPAVCAMPQPHGFTSGKVFPLYFTLLVALIVLPSIFLFNKSKEFINAGALHMTILIGTLISLIWETTMAIPYGWWGYQPDFMLGIYVAPWYNLPLESVILWITAGWSTIFMYEFFRLQCVTNLPLFVLMFGKAGGFEESGAADMDCQQDPNKTR